MWAGRQVDGAGGRTGRRERDYKRLWGIRNRVWLSGNGRGRVKYVEILAKE